MHIVHTQLGFVAFGMGMGCPTKSLSVRNKVARLPAEMIARDSAEHQGMLDLPGLESCPSTPESFSPSHESLPSPHENFSPPHESCSPPHESFSPTPHESFPSPCESFSPPPDSCPPPPYRLSLSLPALTPSPGRWEEVARKKRQRRAR